MLLLTVPHSGSMFSRALVHACTGRYGDMQFSGAPFPHKSRSLYFGHYNPDHASRVKALIAEGHQPLGTIRDPILSILTHKRLHRDTGSAGFLIDNLIAMHGHQPILLAIGLDESVDRRREILIEWLERGERYLNFDEIEGWARDWPVINASGTDDRTDAYKAGDLAAVRDLPEWPAFDNQRARLASIYIKHGFDLPWL